MSTLHTHMHELRDIFTLDQTSKINLKMKSHILAVDIQSFSQFRGDKHGFYFRFQLRAMS